MISQCMQLRLQHTINIVSHELDYDCDTIVTTTIHSRSE